MLEDASAETSAGQQCKSGAPPLAHKFNYKQCKAEASNTEHQWACKDVVETIEDVPYHEVFIHSFKDYNTLGVPTSTSLVATISHPSTSTSYLETMAGPCLLEHNWSG
ncbi:hypothetical protein CMV_017809 [Castanea mollissima]|uniref:Uncharacterized protein n=1 Tax=Castanea mollissima TaxID=60419 RepID=A0A8J4VQ90_9ROSI|nr:hypothetical protein CMV_017809 [Castanea mollissima]